MRIIVGGIIHESNTFNPQPTTLADFSVDRGEDLVTRWAAAHNEMGGFLHGAGRYATVLPTLYAMAVPAGAVTSDAFEALVGELIDAIVAEQPFDGVLLALHGAMVSEQYPAADGEIARRLRATLGPNVPIVCTHDPHANIAPLVVQSVDALLAYRTNPHIDQRETGERAAALLHRVLRDNVRPLQALRQPPLLLNILHQNTSREPLASVLAAARALEAEPGILAANIVLGYQYADVPAVGPTVVVVADGDQALADKAADRLSTMLWEMRDKLGIDRPDAATAVTQALACDALPVILVDMGDNIGGGSAGDSTFLLHELLRQGATGWVVVLADPEAVHACAAAGIGATLTLPVGGKIDQFHGTPATVSGRITTLHDGRYIETEARHGGYRYNDQGLTAVLEVDGGGADPASLLVLTTLREAPMSLHQLLSLGIQPQRQRIIVVKAAIAWRAAYEPIAGTIIEVNTPGLTSIDPANFTYHHARQPLWGLDR